MTTVSADSLSFRQLSSLVLTSQSLYSVLLSTVVGTSIFHSFVASPLSYSVLSRPDFAKVQSTTFPAYFTVQSLCSGGLLALVYKTKGKIAGVTGGLIAVMTLGSLGNMVLIGPWATRVMQRRARVERLEGTPRESSEPKSAKLNVLGQKFAVLHSISMVLNLGVILGGLGAVIGWGNGVF